jgi:hypothetical protein
MPNDAITPFILAVPQYKTSIDGLGIHFLHVRSKHKNALPLIITHGWPGSGFSRALIGAVTVKRKEESHD